MEPDTNNSKDTSSTLNSQLSTLNSQSSTLNSQLSILNYFPDLSPLQQEQIGRLYGLYEEGNLQINVISRKDFPNFYERHVLHSLGIAKVIQFKAGTKIMDVGTGGGFPGIP